MEARLGAVDLCVDGAQEFVAVDAQALAARGIAVPFHDAFGIQRQAPLDTLEQLAHRFGAKAPHPPIVATPGRYHPNLYGVIELESGYRMRITGTLQPRDFGYHHLLLADGERRLVIAAPEHMPQPSRTWGWAVQLYAARSTVSWGIGDFADLATVAGSAAHAGAGMILVSPIHAAAPTLPQQNSPYSPSSRLWLNMQYIAVPQVPGAELVDLADLTAAGRALNAARLIDRDSSWTLKLTALRRIWQAIGAAVPPDAAAFVATCGLDLVRFATYCALAEENGTANWRNWPEAQQRADAPAVLAAQVRLVEQVAFWSWCQWVADVQLARACGRGVDVVADLAVGFDSCGADAWIYQDALAFDFEVGCPPDAHNQEGQRWGLPPLDPDALVRMDLAPFVQMVRAGLRHATALRIDHVMQLWRMFWIPSHRSAQRGAYVHYPVDALLAVLRLEAYRAGAWICGEDMGTVSDVFRETMADIGMLGYRAAMRSVPAGNPGGSMAASSTHDQVTVAGAITGSDALDLARIGKAFSPDDAEEVRRALAKAAGIDPARDPATLGPADIEAAVLAQYHGVATSPSLVAVITLDDAGGVAERPNMPGTIDQWPNWRLGLPIPVDDLLSAPLARRIGKMMRGAGR